MRLLYYFPEQAAGMIAERLSELDVTGVGPYEAPGMSQRQIEARKRRKAANGVWTPEFLRAVAWCREPAVHKELLGVFRRTTDPYIALAAVPALESTHKKLLCQRLKVFIDELPAEEGGPFGAGYELLVCLAEHSDEDSKPVFHRYMENAGIQRRRTMCHVLRKARGDWSTGLLAPLLTDKRATGWTYGVYPGQNKPRLPIRVCDEAAQTISMQFPSLSFRLAGNHRDLDRKIETMQSALGMDSPE
jgi:hypothetical protein